MELVFSDLIDVAKAQELMDGYYAVTGIPTGIIDGEGRVWTATGWLDICTKFHRVNPVTAERCKESDTYIKHHLEAGKPFVSYTCAHGLTDVASPIVVAGRHVAQVMTGQLFLQEPDIGFFRNQAREFGFDEEAYLKALAEVPVITEDKLDSIMKFLVQLAQFLADMGYKRLKELEAQEEVVRLNRELECRVIERTAELQAANTELARTLGSLKETQSHLIQTEKLAALGDLVAGVAHEINTPTGVGVTAASYLERKTREFTGLFQEGTIKKSDLEKFLGICGDAAGIILLNLRRAAELIASFKRVAVDQSSEERRMFKVKEYIGEILLSLRPKLKQNAFTIELKCDDALEMDSYPGAFSQIITNMIVNTVMHAYDEGKSGVVVISVEKEGDWFVLTYADDGRGIEPRHLSKIFDPFFTTKRGKGGTGLGLYILYNLVTQKLHGTVACESGPGQGATFIIRFPDKHGEKAT
jgi:signal transduction histidine kinase